MCKSILRMALLVTGMLMLSGCSSGGGTQETQASTKNETVETTANAAKSSINIVENLKAYGSSRSDLKFELADSQSEFIKDHIQFFPATYEDLEELSTYIDWTLDYPHMIKNPVAQVGKMAFLDGLTVAQIVEEQAEGGDKYDYATQITLCDYNQNVYRVLYVGRSTPLIEGDTARIIGMPIANSSYANTEGTTILTLVMLASVVEDSYKSEITGNYFSDGTSASAYVPETTYVAAREWAGDWSYMIPGSDTRYLDRFELSGLSSAELRIARNEIYARHGRKFNDASLQSYFNGKAWYTPLIDPDYFNEDSLSSIERANIKLIQDVEAHGV